MQCQAAFSTFSLFYLHGHMRPNECFIVFIVGLIGISCFSFAYFRLATDLQDISWKYRDLQVRMQSSGILERLTNLQILNESVQKLSIALNESRRTHQVYLKAHEYWTVKNHTTLPSVKVIPSKVLDLERMHKCAQVSFNSSVDKFDVVMLWINISESGYTDWLPKYKGDARGNAYAGVGHNRPPYSELVFALRSMEKHGMMKYVNTIFIVYDDTRHGPPQFIDKLQPGLRVVPHSELMAGTKFISRVRRLHTVLAYLHHIQGLSEYFFFMNDDQMLVNPFQLESLFDSETGLMQTETSSSSPNRPGWPAFEANLEQMFGKRQRKVDMHCPFICKKCLLEEMEAIWGENYVCNPDIKWPLCELNFHFNSFVQNYAIDRGAARAGSFPGTKCVELHTSVKQTPATFQKNLQRSIKMPTHWFNLQGAGVSDEYVKYDDLRKASDDFYFRTYPNRTRFELPDYMPS